MAEEKLTGSDGNLTGSDEKPADSRRSKTNVVINEILGWIEAILFAFIFAMLIRGFVFVTTEVNMPSMENTLKEGHRLIVYKLGYKLASPHKGDIVVFEHHPGNLKGIVKYLIPVQNPGEVDYIKRIIGLPGDKVDLRDGKMIVNGKTLVEPYVKGITDSKGMQFPFTVPPKSLFVMGDNREVSSDSREFGFIPMDKVVGKAVFRIWPLELFGGIYGKSMSYAI